MITLAKLDNWKANYWENVKKTTRKSKVIVEKVNKV